MLVRWKHLYLIYAPKFTLLSVSDVIDIVKDVVTGADYVEAEDPSLFISNKTGRGPLSVDWLNEYWNEVKGKEQPTKNNKSLMCAYKLCRVEFRYWGMQTKLEKFIHDVALRKTMVKAHRQAWAWQDEWVGLTINDIREMERQIQEALQRKMAGNISEDELNEHETENAVRQEVDVKSGFDKIDSQTPKAMRESLHEPFADRKPFQIDHEDSPSTSEEDQFYDCLGENADNKSLAVWSSMELLMDHNEYTSTTGQPKLSPADINYEPRKKPSVMSTDSGYPCPIQYVFFVFHGGSVLDSVDDVSAKKSDLTTFRGVLEFVMRQHYHHLVGHVSVKQITCSSVCSSVLSTLSSMHPFSYEQAFGENNMVAETQIGVVPLLVANTPRFKSIIDQAILSANQTYNDFLNSDEGRGFAGQVTIVGDSVGSLIAYEALMRSTVRSRDVLALEFEVGEFFTFGSPLALALAMKQMQSTQMNIRPPCQQFYNLFHATDPVSLRLEPLIDPSMSSLAPVNIPRYSRHPKGNGQPLDVG